MATWPHIGAAGPPGPTGPQGGPGAQGPPGETLWALDVYDADTISPLSDVGVELQSGTGLAAWHALLTPGLVEVYQPGGNASAFRASRTADADWRVIVTNDGEIKIGDGTGPPDAVIARSAPGELLMAGLKIGASEPATGPGLYVQGGALMFKGGNASLTEIAAA